MSAIAWNTNLINFPKTFEKKTQKYCAHVTTTQRNSHNISVISLFAAFINLADTQVYRVKLELTKQ